MESEEYGGEKIWFTVEKNGFNSAVKTAHK